MRLSDLQNKDIINVIDMDALSKIKLKREIEKNKLSKMNEEQIHNYFARKRVIGQNRADKLLKRENNER